MKIGLFLIGTSKEIVYFVSQLVRYHHHTTKPVERIKEPEINQYLING